MRWIRRRTERTRLTPGRVQGAVALVLLLSLGASSCAVDAPTVERTDAASAGNASPAAATPAPAQFEPTVPPATAPSPTPVPEPTATPEPALATLPVETPTLTSAPTIREPGLVAIPIAGTATFRLSSPRPILQLPGHTLIYLDPDLQAEVDIFTPVATGDGTPLVDYDAVVAEITTNPLYEDLAELPAVSIGGQPTRVFEGRPLPGARGFYGDLSTLDNDSAGWFPPARLRLWLIDTPNGPVAVTAESLLDPGQYTEAITMAAAILSTITFDR